MFLQNSNSIQTGGYNIANSLRFQSASSQYATRTYGTPTNNTKWTWSGWVKRGNLTSGQTILNVGSSGVYDNAIAITASGQIEVVDYRVSPGYVVWLQTTAVYRDPSSWYHIYIVYDSTQATAANRLQIYVNGVQVTAFAQAIYPPLNHQMYLNAAGLSHQLGRNYAGIGYCDLYLTENYFVDGQSLTTSSFGETDTLTGQWVAKKYTGTYGTNGFYLPFSNGTSTTTLGADSSGNSNNWTLTNFTRSAGVSDCWMVDVPSGNGSSVGGTQPNSNYCVLNPLNTILPLSGANLIGTQSTAAWTSSSGTIAASSGKYYYEASMSTIGSGNYIALGLMLTGTAFNQYAGSNTNSWSVLTNSTNLSTYFNAAATNATTISATSSTAFQVAVDIDAGKLWLGYNNNWLGGGNPASGTSPTYTFTANSLVNPIISGYSNIVHLNCGQRSFAYTPPTGFKALCTANLPTATIKKGSDNFNTILWTGDGALTRSITGLSFSPDFVWTKYRSGAISHALFNSVVGAGANKGLASNTTDSESSFNDDATNGYLSSFDSNGFSVVRGSTGAYTNNNTIPYVAWCWDAGSSTVTNTNGTISSQVRANPTAGVSVVTYTGNGTSGATVGHGLGVAPSMIIVKGRSTTSNWPVYHASIPNTQAVLLNTTAAAAGIVGTYWNSTSPTSSVFSLGGVNSGNNTSSATYVAYCFSEIAGFSRFGSYTGNGSADGPMVWTGFAPRYVMIKQTNGANDWWVMDTARDPYNVGGAFLSPNLSNAESSGNVFWDALSNGFKLRNLYSQVNGNGNTYIYMAFASNPFSSSNAK